jgi:hypothetical protein
LPPHEPDWQSIMILAVADLPMFDSLIATPLGWPQQELDASLAFHFLLPPFEIPRIEPFLERLLTMRCWKATAAGGQIQLQRVPSTDTNP